MSVFGKWTGKKINEGIYENDINPSRVYRCFFYSLSWIYNLRQSKDTKSSIGNWEKDEIVENILGPCNVKGH